MKQEIKIGHTNKKKWVEGNQFIIEKTFTGFNHKLKYEELQEFDFVPKLIANNDKEIIWEYLPEAEQLQSFSTPDLQEIARILRQVHKSNIELPKNNLRKRVMTYLEILHAKGLRPKCVEDNYQEMQKLLSRMSSINPTHNDVWYENILKTKSGKIFLVDWEYATMGDKHFDLAFFIESSRLDANAEQVFLEAYNSHDDYEAYNPELMPRYKRLVHYITICWAYAQEKMPFPIDWMEAYLERTK